MSKNIFNVPANKFFSSQTCGRVLCWILVITARQLSCRKVIISVISVHQSWLYRAPAPPPSYRSQAPLYRVLALALPFTGPPPRHVWLGPRCTGSPSQTCSNLFNSYWILSNMFTTKHGLLKSARLAFEWNAFLSSTWSRNMQCIQ